MKKLSRIENRCLAALKDSYRKYKISGPRSTEKIKPLHGWVIDEISRSLDDDYSIIGQGVEQTGEVKIKGMYYPKNVDVAVKIGDTCIGVVSIKFVCSNYRQNANNYFENQIGETANLRRNDIVFGHLLCIKHPIPYLTKKKQVGKYEYLNDNDIQKYIELSKDHIHLYSPDVQGLIVVHAGENYGSKSDYIKRFCKKDDFPNLSDSNFNLLKNKLNINRFFRIFVEKIELKRDELGL